MTTSFKDKKELSNADITRLTAAVGDLAAIGTAYIPGYGTAASTVLGVGSTLANLGADIADGENLGSALSDAGVNLGLDTIGLIPGLGTSGKIGKITKTLTKFAPWIIASMSVSNLGNELKSFKKLVTNPTSVSADDLKNVASGLSVILGIRQGLKGRNIRNKALNPD
nr:MAG TPA: NolX protein [Caudoviricetes sp.]